MCPKLTASAATLFWLTTLAYSRAPFTIVILSAPHGTLAGANDGGARRGALLMTYPKRKHPERRASALAQAKNRPYPRGSESKDACSWAAYYSSRTTVLGTRERLPQALGTLTCQRICGRGIRERPTPGSMRATTSLRRDSSVVGQPLGWPALRINWREPTFRRAAQTHLLIHRRRRLDAERSCVMCGAQEPLPGNEPRWSADPLATKAVVAPNCQSMCGCSSRRAARDASEWVDAPAVMPALSAESGP